MTQSLDLTRWRRQGFGRPAVELGVEEPQVVAGVPPDRDEPTDGVVVEDVEVPRSRRACDIGSPRKRP